MHWITIKRKLGLKMNRLIKSSPISSVFSCSSTEVAFKIGHIPSEHSVFERNASENDQTAKNHAKVVDM